MYLPRSSQARANGSLWEFIPHSAKRGALKASALALPHRDLHLRGQLKGIRQCGESRLRKAHVKRGKRAVVVQAERKAVLWQPRDSKRTANFEFSLHCKTCEP